MDGKIIKKIEQVIADASEQDQELIVDAIQGHLRKKEPESTSCGFCRQSFCAEQHQ